MCACVLEREESALSLKRDALTRAEPIGRTQTGPVEFLWSGQHRGLIRFVRLIFWNNALCSKSISSINNKKKIYLHLCKK